MRDTRPWVMWDLDLRLPEGGTTTIQRFAPDAVALLGVFADACRESGWDVTVLAYRESVIPTKSHEGWGSVRDGRWHRTVSPTPTFTAQQEALCGIRFTPLNVTHDGFPDYARRDLHACKRCERATKVGAK